MTAFTSAPSHTLAAALWPQAAGGAADWLRAGALALAGSLLLTLSAKIQVPFFPVPMTLQTGAVLLLAMACGWKLGGSAVLLYLGQGAAGLPVFAGAPEKGIGLAYMMGPTGGYLAGFLAAALLCGWLAERGWSRGLARTALAMLLGLAVIYALGLMWLGTLAGWDKPLLAWGFTPFILGDLAKVAVAAIAVPALWRVVKKR